MSKLHPTKNDLPQKLRSTMVDLLNEQLASAIDLGLQAKQAHWNVKGPGFLQLHELFDKAHEEANSWADLLAERAVQLGGIAEGTLSAVTQRTTLAAYRGELAEGAAHADAVSSAIATFAASVRQAISKAERANDAGTADLLTEVSRGADKLLWFVEAHLQAER